jgi:hypothetical protein
MLFAGFVEGKYRHGSVPQERSLGRTDVSAAPAPTAAFRHIAAPIAGERPNVEPLLVRQSPPL